MLFSKLFTGQQNSQPLNPSTKVQARTIHLSASQLKKKKPLNTKKLFTSLGEVSFKSPLNTYSIPKTE